MFRHQVRTRGPLLLKKVVVNSSLSFKIFWQLRGRYLVTFGKRNVDSSEGLFSKEGLHWSNFSKEGLHCWDNLQSWHLLLHAPRCPLYVWSHFCSFSLFDLILSCYFWSHHILSHFIWSHHMLIRIIFFCLIFLHFLSFPLIIFVMCFFFILWHLYHHIFSCSDFSWFFFDMTIFSYYF